LSNSTIHPGRRLARGLTALGCAGTLAAWMAVGARLAADAQARFTAFGEAREQLFERHVRRVLDVALSHQGLLLASDDVSEAEFRTHFEILRVRENLPEVLSVRLDTWDPVGRRLSMRYRVPDGTAGVAEPWCDLRRAAMTEAARHGHGSVLTAPHRLAEGPMGVEFGLPVFRRDSLLGLVNLSIDLERLVMTVLPEGVNLPYRVRLHDIGTVDGAETMAVNLYDSARQTPAPAGPMAWVPWWPSWHAALASPALERRHVIEIGRRLWQLEIAQPPVVHLWQSEAWLVLLSGALSTLLLGLGLGRLQRRVEHSAEALRAMDQRVASDGVRLRGIVDQSTDGIITFDADGVVQSANPAAAAMFGHSALSGRALSDLVAPADQPALQRHLDGLSDGSTPAGERLVMQAVRADGTQIPLALVCRPLLTATRGGECLGTLRDLSSGQRVAAALHKLAYRDALTGLVNREAFQKHLAQVLEHRRAQPPADRQAPLCLLLIDLDRLQKINETLGYPTGDRVLLETAARLRAALEESDMLARLGGDEFAVLLEGAQALARGQTVARAVLRQVSEPMEVDGHPLRVTTSIGITSLGHAADLDGVTLMGQADSALWMAKQSGGSQLHVHHHQDRQLSPERLQLEVDLHRALERRELELYFQPQFDCRTRTLVGAEALLRWHHRSQGMVAPDVFIPMAEASGLIVPIGRWVLDEACRQARCWAATGAPSLTVAVNLASRQLVDDDVLGAVREALVRHGLAPQSLELEITESAAVTDIEQARGLLDQLAGLGVAVSIDDFGVGYSSLSYLRDLPVQRFKIDRSFLANVPQDAGSSRLVSAMVAMAGSLGVGLVAEGVETPEQLAFLAEQHCDVVQGYLLGRPMPADEFLRRLRSEWLTS
jgi:diguanylate cyclase (GGDEF)-like protein/PAS domain S-box-containing protein